MQRRDNPEMALAAAAAIRRDLPAISDEGCPRSTSLAAIMGSTYRRSSKRAQSF